MGCQSSKQMARSISQSVPELKPEQQRGRAIRQEQEESCDSSEQLDQCRSLHWYGAMEHDHHSGRRPARLVHFPAHGACHADMSSATFGSLEGSSSGMMIEEDDHKKADATANASGCRAPSIGTSKK